MVYFRVDGNKVIATGHVMRCLTIAQALRELGEESVFVLADDSPKALIADRGFSFAVLDSDWRNLEQETERMIAYICENKVKSLVIDSYFVTKEYLRRLREHTKVTYIDDRNAFVYPADRIVNYGFLSERIPYRQAYEQAGQPETEFLVGSRYIPLRKEFQNTAYEVADRVKHILITTGGTDNYNVAGRILHCAAGDEAFADVQFHVVMGCFNQNKSFLRQLEAQSDRIHVYENITTMSRLMQNCDVAVTAGGSTTYELCAVGIPSVCLSVADNQTEGVRNWDREGVMLYAGTMQEDEGRCTDEIVRHLKTYMESYELRKERSRTMKKLVDGRGAERIARTLVQEQTLRC